MKYLTYLSYKDSGIKWLGKVPKHWTTCAVWIGFELGRGRVINKREIQANVGQYPVYSSQTKNNGEIGRINTYDFEGNYITWTTDGAKAGTVFERHGFFNCTNVCGTLKPRTKKWHLTFYRYVLDTASKWFVRYDINPKLMNNVMSLIRIPKLPYYEQKQIASFLTKEVLKIDTLIEKQQQLIKLLQEKRLALISHVVTKGLNPSVEMKESEVRWLGEIPKHWEISRIKFIARLNCPKSEVRLLPANNPVTFLPMETIGKQGQLDTSHSKILLEVLNGYTYVAENDVIIAKITPCFENRKGAIAKNLLNGIAFATTEVIPLRCKGRANNKFLYYLLYSDPFRGIAKGSMYGAGGQKRVGDNFVANYKFALAPLIEQTQIATFLDQQTVKIDALIAKSEQFISLIKERRTALIASAVTGKIDVRNVVLANEPVIES